jgi:hypothetical protein
MNAPGPAMTRSGRCSSRFSTSGKTGGQLNMIGKLRLRAAPGDAAPSSRDTTWERGLPVNATCSKGGNETDHLGAALHVVAFWVRCPAACMVASGAGDSQSHSVRERTPIHAIGAPRDSHPTALTAGPLWHLNQAVSLRLVSKERRPLAEILCTACSAVLRMWLS